MTDKGPIASAEAKARGVSPPPTPEGYSDPYQFEYPKLLLVVAAIALTVVFTVVYGIILVQIQHRV
ncbi:hypothetical protein [Natronomonas amylolytica]|uniref:hypothetical protein n=1 Tax=Natronomonas amylolytica TaxID=3108498 RepID=UPI0030091F85